MRPAAEPLLPDKNAVIYGLRGSHRGTRRQ
jgi:hypothetical protein